MFMNLKSRLIRKDHLNVISFLNLSAALAAVVIVILVLFKSPMPGVSDQGDFQRVMTLTGLKEINMDPKYLNNYWFKYVTTQYSMVHLSLARLMGIIPTTSMIYPITLARIISFVTGAQYFSTKLLAGIYSVLYVISLYMCLKYLALKKISTSVFISLLSLLILMDGSYLVWFNSLYGEPMMIVSLLLLSSVILYISQHTEESRRREITFFFVSSYLFLGAKLQCFTTLPFMLFMLFHIAALREKTKHINSKRALLITYAVILIFYVGGIYMQINSTCGVDTKFNAVFYGVLKDSKDPKEDLAVLGLSPDMAVEAGKHAYMPKNQYIKYVPWSELTDSAFNKKISNLKLLRFYLLHPVRLMRGMEYTASKSFDTLTSLGKYEKSEIKNYTPNLSRFTIWSTFRSTEIPKKLTFLIPFYILIFLVSIGEYARAKNNKSIRFRIELIWLIAAIGIIQFPMPFIGNGEADTAKQLFLFNYTFDIMFLVCCTWIFDRSLSLLNIFIKNFISIF